MISNTRTTEFASLRRLVIVVRADPVICGHSGEARNLAEAALTRGFTEVRIVTWPIARLIESGLPLKPLDGIAPYSDGVIVERPEPVGDYKVPDGRYLSGLTGRLIELFTDGVPTLAMSLYLSPHTIAITDAVRAAEATGLPVNVVTIAEAVGSDVTNVVRSCVEENRFGAAAHVLSSYLELRHPGGGVGLHPAVDHRIGRGDRRPARHPLRRPVHANGWPSPTRRSTPPSSSIRTRPRWRRGSPSAG